MTTTTQANYIATIFSTEVIEAAHENLVMAELCWRRFESDLKYGNSVIIPALSAITVDDKSANTAINFTSTTETNSRLNVNYHKYAAFIVEDIAELQSEINQRNLYSTRVGYDIAHAVDVICINHLDDFTNTVGTDDVDVTDDNLLAAVVYLSNANAPTDTRSLVISPETWSSIMKIDKFVRLDYHNIAGATAVERALMSQPIYGAKTYVTSNCEDGSSGHIMGMFHKNAIALVMQSKPTVHTEYSVDYLGWKVACDVIFGTLVTRNDHGCEILGK